MPAPPQSSLRAPLLALLSAGGALLVFALAGLVDPYAAAVVAAVAASGWLWPFRHARPPSEPPAEPPAAPPTLPLELLEQFPDPVILLNGAREILAVNRPARDLLGVGMLGRDLALTVRHPDVIAAVETLAAGVPELRVEILLPLPTQRTFTLHAGSLAPGGGANGPRYLLVLHDETRAKRAEQTRADFVANASHELRSPLSSLIGFIETLRGPAVDDAEARERFLGLMYSEAKRMARLVEDLLSLSRVEINEHVPPRRRVEVGEVIATVVETLGPRAAARTMTIAVDVPDDLPAVIGDADQLVQVFHNLLDNAIKYGRAGSTVRIAARSADRGGGAAGVAVAVSDEGDGIKAIHLPRLTERFYRADEGRSRRLGGTGLGLAIVKHIVNRHRGRLTVESKEGIGSTFTVHLPAAVPEAAPVAPGRVRPDRPAGEAQAAMEAAGGHRHKSVTPPS